MNIDLKATNGTLDPKICLFKCLLFQGQHRLSKGFFIMALYSSSELFSFYSFKELCVWIVSTKLSSLSEVML